MGVATNEKAMSMTTSHITELESLCLVGVPPGEEPVPTDHWSELQEALTALGVGDLLPSPEDPAVLRTIIPVDEGAEGGVNTPPVKGLEVVVVVPQNPVPVAAGTTSSRQLYEALTGVVIFFLLSVVVLIRMYRGSRTLKYIPENRHLLWSVCPDDGCRCLKCLRAGERGM